MSLRRKSCDACFKGRRKCDNNYPTCKRCKKNQKACHYIVTPPVPDAGSVSRATSDVVSSGSFEDFESVELPEQLWQSEDDPWDNFNSQNDQLEGFQQFSIPSFLGSLGEIQPVSANTKSWEWVIGQLKSLPQSFAQNAETMCIHKELYRNDFPQPIRAAFGICSAYLLLNDSNRSMVFRNLEAEASGHFQPVQNGTLLEALSRLQSLVLYQTIRMYHGDLKQRTLAEQQEGSVAALGLQLLRRADIELREEETTWRNWILSESIRRTVMTGFMLYAIYSIFKHGVCTAFPTLSILPVSVAPEQWKSSPDLHFSVLKETMEYGEYTDKWIASPQLTPEPFEKMLLVACKGIDQVEALVFPADLF